MKRGTEGGGVSPEKRKRGEKEIKGEAAAAKERGGRMNQNFMFWGLLLLNKEIGKVDLNR